MSEFIPNHRKRKLMAGVSIAVTGAGAIASSNLDIDSLRKSLGSDEALESGVAVRDLSSLEKAFDSEKSAFNAGSVYKTNSKPFGSSEAEAGSSCTSNCSTSACCCCCPCCCSAASGDESIDTYNEMMDK